MPLEKNPKVLKYRIYSQSTQQCLVTILMSTPWSVTLHRFRIWIWSGVGSRRDGRWCSASIFNYGLANIDPLCRFVYCVFQQNSLCFGIKSKNDAVVPDVFLRPINGDRCASVVKLLHGSTHLVRVVDSVRGRMHAVTVSNGGGAAQRAIQIRV